MVSSLCLVVSTEEQTKRGKMHDELTSYFDNLSTTEIRKELSGKWGDYYLLDVLALFDDQEDTERATAVLELILASPDHNSDIVAYSELYDSIIYTHINEKNFAAAAYWTVAAIAYDTEHYDDEMDFRNYQRSLAEIYILQGDINAGIQLSTRLLQTNPADLWTYNKLAATLSRVGLHELALAALDRALILAKEHDPDALASHLKCQYDKLVEKKETTPSPAIHPDTLAQFHHALTLPPLPEDDSYYYQSPMTDLLYQDETLDNNLRLSIEAQGNILIPELIQLAFDEEHWGTAVNRHTITLLHQIHTTQPALDSLNHWLDQATDENWHRLLSHEIGKIGGYTAPELQALITDTRLETFIRSNAARALLGQMAEFPEQRDEIITFFRTLLTREEAYQADEELFIALLISAITDSDAQELYPEIKQVFDEDRLDPTVTDLAFINQKWDMPPLPSEEIREDGLYLMLDCKKCGRKRKHFVQHVTIDLNTRNNQLEGKKATYDPHVMDRPIICPKCGAVDQYKTDALTHMRLTIGGGFENIMAIMSDEEPKDISPSPFISQVRPQAFGRDMHPLVALDKYKQMALSNPKQAEPHWRMGNVLRTIWRDEPAREEYRWALSLNPKDPWVHYALAATEHDMGNHDGALALYQKAMRLISPLAMFKDEELMSISMMAADGIKALKKGLPSPYAQDYREAQPEPAPKKLSRKERRAQKKKEKKKNKKRRH